MPAQQQKPGRNYIGILSDRLEEQREALLLVKPNRPMKDYLRDLMAAVMNRRGDVKLSPPIALAAPPPARNFME